MASLWYEISRRVAWKLFRAPGSLPPFLRYKLGYGSEYLYFDLVDLWPGLGDAVAKVVPVRADLQSPVFLVGLRRSGTTLLYRLLGAHPDLWLFNERFPGDRMGALFPTPSNIWSIHDLDEFHRVAMRYLSPVRRLWRQRWGVKLALELAHPDPGSVSAAGLRQIAAAFPRARFIGIVRDPRDFVLSATCRAGHDVQWWIDEYRCLCDLFAEMRSLYPDSFMTIRYLDLQERVEDTMRRCCEFIGLRYVPEMLDPSHWPIKGPQAYERDGIVKRAGKWREVAKVDPEAIARIERACFPAASAYGFEPSLTAQPVRAGYRPPSRL